MQLGQVHLLGVVLCSYSTYLTQPRIARPFFPFVFVGITMNTIALSSQCAYFKDFCLCVLLV